MKTAVRQCLICHLAHRPTDSRLEQRNGEWNDIHDSLGAFLLCHLFSLICRDVVAPTLTTSDSRVGDSNEAQKRQNYHTTIIGFGSADEAPPF